MTRLAEGTMPGTARRPDYGVEVPPEVKEVLAAQRDHLLDLLERVVGIVPNGYMPPEHLEVVREARSALVQYGRALGENKTWVDR